MRNKSQVLEQSIEFNKIIQKQNKKTLAKQENKRKTHTTCKHQYIKTLIPENLEQTGWRKTTPRPFFTQTDGTV